MNADGRRSGLKRLSVAFGVAVFLGAGLWLFQQRPITPPLVDSCALMATPKILDGQQIRIRGVVWRGALWVRCDSAQAQARIWFEGEAGNRDPGWDQVDRIQEDIGEAESTNDIWVTMRGQFDSGPIRTVHAGDFYGKIRVVPMLDIATRSKSKSTYKMLTLSPVR
jgi:hypothetical protein